MAGPPPVYGGEPAQNVVEYALLITTVAILVLLAASAFGLALSDWWHVIFTRIISYTG